MEALVHVRRARQFSSKSKLTLRSHSTGTSCLPCESSPSSHPVRRITESESCSCVVTLLSEIVYLNKALALFNTAVRPSFALSQFQHRANHVFHRASRLPTFLACGA